MKPLYSLLLLLSIYFSSYGQITDTCEYVHQNNTLGGLDCAMLSTSQLPIDSFQWINCDSLFAPFPNNTTSYYMGPATSINVALVISAYGCIDTSDCYYVCSASLEELKANKVELIGVLDLMGRKTEDKPNTLQIYIYSDGTTEKVFRIE